MIEEIDLRANYADSIAQREELFPICRRTQVLAVFPKPHSNFLPSRIFNQLAHLILGPFLPETFDDVVLESELASETRKFLHAFESTVTSVEIFPNSATWFYPRSLQAGRKYFLIRDWRNIADDVAIDERVQIRSRHHNAPW